MAATETNRIEPALLPQTEAAEGSDGKADVGQPGPARDGRAPEARAPLATRALAARVQAVPPSGIRRFFDILATMDDVISLGVGEPDFDTPTPIVEAGIRSLRAGRTHYTSNYGTFELRNALVEHLERRYGVSYDPAKEILVTVGASEAAHASGLSRPHGSRSLIGRRPRWRS